jgi:hypothetical protein
MPLVLFIVLAAVGVPILLVGLVQAVDSMQRFMDRFSIKLRSQPTNGWRVKVRKGTYTHYDSNFAFLKRNVPWRTWFRGLFVDFFSDVKAPAPYVSIDTYYVPDELVIDTNNGGIRFYRHPNDKTTIVTVQPDEVHLLERKYVDYAQYYLDPRVPRSDCAIVTAVTAEAPDQAATWLPMFREYRFGWLERFWFGRILSRLYSHWTPRIQHLLENNPQLRRMVNCRYIQPAARLLQRGKQQSGLAKFITNVRVLIRYALGVANIRCLLAIQRV